ncbi:KamA family radical SAM protein [Streptomyces sp. NPDC093249]|uniref:KamA family radical SAM protein n=1 Tax=unclassified Streptomyces TaxID=2593676 RepID=UPI0034506D93
MTDARRGRRPRFYNAAHLDHLTARAGLGPAERLAVRAVATVLPFRVSDYVVEELIDWDAAPDDPLYRLTFPQPDMLPRESVARIAGLLEREAPHREVAQAAAEVRRGLNPHPAGQLDLNVPRLDGEPMAGLQHKYPETVLFFPRQGQTCHSYCTYCFRWPQFVNEPALKIATGDVERLCSYLRRHREVRNVLITGGDPMVMSTAVLAPYIDALLDDPLLDHVESIRIGTKALSYWPHRFVSDPDADDMLKLFEKVQTRGKHLAFMAHLTHPRELETATAERAVRRVLGTGAVIRTQSPVIRGVNDCAHAWAELWRREARLGMVPYYMFVERDTGPRDFFAVPLVRAYEIFSDAYRSVPGLCRTVRGPVMSATPGKVLVDGVPDIEGRRLMSLRFLQCRDPAVVNQPLFAEFDETAVWLDDLRLVIGPRRALDLLRTHG